MLYGFLSGLAASDYDLEYIYIDGLMRFIRTELSTLTELFDQIERFSALRGINVVMSVSGTAEELPEFMKKFVLQLV